MNLSVFQVFLILTHLSSHVHSRSSGKALLRPEIIFSTFLVGDFTQITMPYEKKTVFWIMEYIPQSSASSDSSLLHPVHEHAPICEVWTGMCSFIYKSC